MNKIISKKCEKNRLYDFLILALVITSLSFYDIKFVFLGVQALVFIYTILIVFRGEKSARKSFAFLIWLVFFAGYSLLSSTWASSENTTAITCSLSVIQVGLIAFCIIVYCDTEVRKSLLVKSFIISALILSVRFFVQVPISAWGKMERFGKETIFGGNGPAITLAFSVILLYYACFIQNSEKKKKNIALAVMLMFSLIAFLMGTKKGLVIIVLGVGLLYISKSKNSVKLVKSLIVVLLAVGIAYYAIMNVPILYGSIGYRVESLLSGLAGNETDLSTEDRSFMVGEALSVFKNNVILGVGQDGYRYENSIHLTYSHNNYVEVLANLGLVGFVIYYSVFTYLLFRSWKNKKTNPLPLVLVIISMILDVAQVSYSDEITYFLLAFIIAFVPKETKNIAK